jgi:deoxyribodipyrimidine photo-lyase
MSKGVFIFRRDLRVKDNLALHALCDACEEVVCIFVFSPEQIERERNPYFSDASFQFMLESLEDLQKQTGGKLLLLRGDTVDVLKTIRKHWSFDRLAFNLDYTPYARKRDGIISEWCNRNEVECLTAFDYTLHDLESVRTQKDEIYQMFTPFYRTASKLPILPTVSVTTRKLLQLDGKLKVSTVKLPEFSNMYIKNESPIVRGGRAHALRRLKRQPKNYSKARDTLHAHTTLMGAYIKFGCVSIREAHKVFKTHEPLLRQLYWREFYAYVTYHTPEVLSESRNYDEDLEVRWVSAPALFRKWCEGRTGFPLVDAGMRQMNSIGWMHNRARMVTASFLVKHLGIDWREGERYFATKLIDYDPCNNNGGWQWCASTGTDAQPYFRIFNPWTQSKTHDPDSTYVHLWVPELRDVPPKHIHRWDIHHKSHNDVDYSEPVVVHAEARKASLERFGK